MHPVHIATNQHVLNPKLKATHTASRIRALLEKHSPFCTRQLKSHPDDLAWLLEQGPLSQPRSVRRLEGEWRARDWGGLGVDATFSQLRLVKRREMLRITVRDLTDAAPLEEIVSELSALADYCLQRGLDACHRDMVARHGKPDAQFAVFGMGKLGGQELNYSSDIDLIFAYSGEGSVGRITHHDFFKRVAGALVQGFRGSGAEGGLFRVDLRLRPEGNSGPITRSLESYENYYAAFGEVWERMALQKARLVAGDAELGYEFTQHLQPFCFPKHLPPSALDEIYQIKSRIEAEILKAGGLERHVKLGRGGIREIEFGVQALQLLHGSRNAFSQERGTLKSLQVLHRLDLLGATDAAELTRAYVFLRRLEHRLQMREDRQTHVVPEDRAEQTAIARGLGFRTHAAFEKEWKQHAARVHSFFERIVQSREGGELEAPPDWETPSRERDDFLLRAGFRDAEKAAATLRTLALGPEYAHVSQRTRGFFSQLTPHIFKISPSLARPDFALQQFERFIEAYGSRAALYELLASNPKTLELLFKLFDHSFFLTDIIVHQPGLLESIAFEGLLSAQHDRGMMEVNLAAETSGSPEARLRHFQRAELLRIELRDILGLAVSPEETSAEISLLADVCLAEAVHQASGAKGFCVIALGKYGGRELSYGSDLDVIFVGGVPETAAKVLAMMGKERGEGIVFRMDARLRPDGEDGPLAISLEAYRSYFAKRAQFWERQSLTRARVAAGDARLGADFLKWVDELVYARPMTDAEQGEMKAMRARIENERGDLSDPARDFKTGAGGLVDVEFLAQAQQLRHGCSHAELRRASTLETLRAMPVIAGWKTKEMESLVEDYRWLRGLESVLRRFYNAPVSQMPASRAEWEIPARHLGLKDAAALEAEMMARRKRIRDRVKQWMAK